jgi:hypothetical protein
MTSPLRQSTWRDRLSRWQVVTHNFWNDVAFRFKHGDELDHLEMDDVGLRRIKCGRVRQSIEWSQITRCYIYQCNTFMFELTAVCLGDDTTDHVVFDELVEGSRSAEERLDALFPGLKVIVDEFSNRAFQAYESGRVEPPVALALVRGQAVQEIPWPSST